MSDNSFQCQKCRKDLGIRSPRYLVQTKRVRLYVCTDCNRRISVQFLRWIAAGHAKYITIGAAVSFSFFLAIGGFLFPSGFGLPPLVLFILSIFLLSSALLRLYIYIRS